MRGFICIGTALSLLALPARAQPDSEAIAAFGLEGHWAISCSGAPSDANPHVHVATTADAAPTRRLVTGNAAIDNVLQLTNARAVGAHQLTFQEKVEGKTITFLLVMEEGRYRIDEMVSSDGKALVTHAVQNWDGKPSPWYSRCQ